MVRKLRKMGIEGKFLDIIERIYSCTENEVIVEDGVTERFRTGKGVRQGCPLSRPLFLAYLEDLEKWWAKEERRTDGSRKEKNILLEIPGRCGDDGRYTRKTAEHVEGFRKI